MVLEAVKGSAAGQGGSGRGLLRALWERRWVPRDRPGALASSELAVPRGLLRAPAAQPLELLLRAYRATFESGWKPLTVAKYQGDFARYLRWLAATGHPATSASLSYVCLAEYAAYLRRQPVVSGVWRGAPDARQRSRAGGLTRTLSANSAGSYMRSLKSLCVWAHEEGYIADNPFHRTHRRAGVTPLVPAEETPPKSATLADLRALERGCAGEGPLDLRDQAIVSLLETTAARNSAVRLLQIGDVDLARNVIWFRRGKGGKTLELALHPETRATVTRYLARGRAALVGDAVNDPGYLFLSADHAQGAHPLTGNALSLLLKRRYRAGGGTLPTFGSHRIRHATATLLVNNGMPLDEARCAVCLIGSDSSRAVSASG